METMTTTRKRLPRYRRAQREVALALTRRDLEILSLVESFRLMTSAHIQALADGSKQGVLRRLQKLYHAGHLDRLRPERNDGGGSEKMVYAIANKGIRALQKAGLVTEVIGTDWNAQNRQLRQESIRHRLLISHTRAVLTAACRTSSGVELLSWKEGREIYDAIEVALPQGYARVPVAADAFFSLRDAKGRMHFFLEADRGTMTVKRFVLKLKAYAAYWRERKHERKFGIQYFRLLTVTTSAARAANLARAAGREDDVRPLGRMFLFAPEHMISLDDPASVLRKIWTTPADREPHAILG